MNTNNNLYTVVYSTIIVVVVAAILAWAAMALKPKQDANIKAETISQMLDAAKIQAKGEAASNDAVLDKYAETIQAAFTVNAAGEKVKDLSTDRASLELADGLKAQNTNLKKGSDVELPVYIFGKDGKKVTVVPVYGAGLWGPVWGYIAFDEDLKTILGAYFDHESEPPGRGAKIKDDPEFRAQFVGKKADFSAEPVFSVLKNAAQDNQVDAITGATMTSKGLGAAIDTWLAAYKPYFTANAPKEKCCDRPDCQCAEGVPCNHEHDHEEMKEEE